MKITFQKSVLEAVVNDSMCSVSDKNAIPVIEGIRFKTEDDSHCSITTYDLEKGFCASVECDVAEEGNYVINAQKLNRIIKFMPDQYITITVGANCKVVITSGLSKFELHAMEGESFPSLPDLSGEVGFTVTGDILKKMISQIFFAIAITDQRPILCGAYFTITNESLKVVSCDGNRLAIREKICSLENTDNKSEPLNSSFVVPGKTLNQLLRLISDDDLINIHLGRKHVIFQMEGKLFFSRLIDGEYIAYQRIIPKESPINVTVDRMGMISSLERASLVTEDKALGQAKSYVRCAFEDDKLKISSVSVTGSVYDEISIKKSGDNIVIGFNCRYLLDALKAADGQRVRITLDGPLKSIIIYPVKEEDAEPSDEEFLYMVSPVKMKE
ncbi:MAG: DNA polymerase III subunit beta [Clostridia bacterium]|nr:DNA polymerase III subunit beta [Clostridia bacterium]